MLGSSLEIATSTIINNTAETGEVISECNSDISVSDRLFSTTDPIYLVCTLYSGNINEIDIEVTTPTTTVTEVDTATTVTDITTTTNRPTAETATVMKATTIQPTEYTSVYFELNGKAYPNNSIIPTTVLSLCLRWVKMRMHFCVRLTL